MELILAYGAATQMKKDSAPRFGKLEEEQTALVEEFAKLTGLFTGKRRKEIEARLAEISAELKID